MTEEASSPAGTRSRWRLLALVVIVVAALVGSFVFVQHARNRQEKAAEAPPVNPVSADLAAVEAVPHIVFRNTTQGQGYGRVAVVPITAPAGPRALTPATCDRVYATAKESICLYAKTGIVTSYHATLLGQDWSPIRELPLSGIPSRTRLSRDSTLSATTTFVYGHSYASPGQFSTATLINRTDGSHTDNVEKFTLLVDGKEITASDRNVWGVTFTPDDDHFFATAASGGKTWLVSGSIAERKLVALRQDAECPSLSPDGTKVAFKTRDGQPPGNWRVAVYDLKTHTAVKLAETRSVDDQVEWLDDKQIMYGLPRGGEGASATDVWLTNADGSGKPKMFIADAWSPAVVR
ncbi:hypothetical protein ODJ79_22035 [Actinoplanes sp. KI2]|uniref:hypothetical protein n=1 Tax=Actinoplanes sp. KI2 TaxID=2983315 RepID=UPI0021D59BD1|nr:hypothetical protein [Actinoplanes sp. KI2]MCU7726419.1 hypothetical protein [Actinoplanes sp. KI2]